MSSSNLSLYHLSDYVPAPTVIIDQRYDEESGQAVPENPTWSVLSFPFRGNYCVFSGELGHGVLDGGDDWPDRMTLLINWWDHQPEAVGEAPMTSRLLEVDEKKASTRLPIPLIDATAEEGELQLVRMVHIPS